MRIAFVALQIVLVAILALTSLVATERSWLLAVVLFSAGALRVLALKSLAHQARLWPTLVFAADALFALPVVTVLSLSLYEQLTQGIQSSGVGTAIALLVMPASSSLLCARLRKTSLT